MNMSKRQHYTILTVIWSFITSVAFMASAHYYIKGMSAEAILEFVAFLFSGALTIMFLKYALKRDIYE